MLILIIGLIILAGIAMTEKQHQIEKTKQKNQMKVRKNQ